MKTQLKAAYLTIVIGFSAFGFFSQTKSDFQQLSQLIGTWQMNGPRGPIFEQWKKLDDTRLAGRSYKIVSGDTIMLEDVQLQFANGKISYCPLVSQQNDEKRIVFTLTECKDGVYTFENKLHDFPQRIVYILPKEGEFKAWIEGTSKGNFKKIEYLFQRQRNGTN